MKIKFLLALLFVVGLGFTSMAQTISVGPRVGVNLATQVAVGDDGEEIDMWNDNVEFTSGLQFGAVANFGFSKLFSLQPELLYVRKGYKFEEDGEKAVGKYNYAEVPVLAMLSFGSETIQGFVTAGPTFSYWLSGEDSYEFDGMELSGDIDFDSDDDGVENRFEAGLSIGGGMAYKVGTGALNFDLRYNAGLTSVYESDNDKASLNNAGISLSIAYLFGL